MALPLRDPDLDLLILELLPGLFLRGDLVLPLNWESVSSLLERFAGLGGGLAAGTFHSTRPLPYSLSLLLPLIPPLYRRKKRGAAGSELDPKWHRVQPALDIHPSTLATHSTTSVNHGDDMVETSRVNHKLNWKI